MIIGTQIELVLQDSAPSHAIARRPPESLAELLDLIREGGLFPKAQLGMLNSTAEHLSRHLGKRPGQIAVAEILEAKVGFRAYLRERRFKRNSVRSYTNYLGILLKQAKKLGRGSEATQVPEAWRGIFDGLQARIPRCARIVRFAIQRKKTPATFSDVDLRDWCQQMISLGRT